jgi:hypothetical protein
VSAIVFNKALKDVRGRLRLRRLREERLLQLAPAFAAHPVSCIARARLT